MSTIAEHWVWIAGLALGLLLYVGGQRAKRKENDRLAAKIRGEDK